MGSDGGVTLWDTRTWRPYGQPLTDTDTWGWLTYSADGRALRVFFEELGVVEISTDPADWVAAACQAAGRNLTPGGVGGHPARPAACQRPAPTRSEARLNTSSEGPDLMVRPSSVDHGEDPHE